MTRARGAARLGRVGRPHGLDGSFYLEVPSRVPEVGAVVLLGGRERTVERRAGTDLRPILRLSGVEDRDAAAALRGKDALEPGAAGVPETNEWPAEQLVGCRIEGMGEVRRVVVGPSCDVLEVGAEGHLVPFVRDAVKRVDPRAGVIEVDRSFLGLEGDASPPSPDGPS